jgi:hypothetical protein
LKGASNAYLDGAGTRLADKQHDADQYTAAQDDVARIEKEVAAIDDRAAQESAKGWMWKAVPRLMLPVSNDTLLRVVRRRARLPTAPLTVVGIDDWAFRRNCRYGTIVCDLERRRIVKLLPDREIATVASFLAGHRTIEVLSRDRGGGYREAGAKALPSAVQVADRWHLMENASAAFLDAVRKSMRSIRATTMDPKLLTAAERLQYGGFLRREDTNSAVLACTRTVCHLKRSCAGSATAEVWCARLSADCVRTSSGHGKARLIDICPCSTRSGTAVAATAPNCGAG